MGKQDLQAFINTKKKIVEEDTTDWNQLKQEWLTKLDELYRNIEYWLKDFDTIKIHYSDIELNEEHIGIYSAKKMTITISDEQVVLEPIGTLIIGTKGRVDMIGKSGKIRMVLASNDSKSPSIKLTISVADKKEQVRTAKEASWKLLTPPPVIKYIDLDSDSFSDALLEAIGG